MTQKGGHLPLHLGLWTVLARRESQMSHSKDGCQHSSFKDGCQHPSFKDGYHHLSFKAASFLFLVSTAGKWSPTRNAELWGSSYVSVLLPCLPLPISASPAVLPPRKLSLVLLTHPWTWLHPPQPTNCKSFLARIIYCIPSLVYSALCSMDQGEHVCSPSSV